MDSVNDRVPEPQGAPEDPAQKKDTDNIQPASVQEELEPAKGHTQHVSLFGSKIDTTSVMPGADAVYSAKIQLINEAILDIGMGKFQWRLTILTGFGWFIDNFWMFSLTIVSPVIGLAFPVSNIAYLTVAQYIGLILGSTGWPVSADFIGRRLAFNVTLGIVGLCGLVGAGMPNFNGLCFIAACVGLACGGNQTVDSTIFLEFVPASHQYLLTVQGVYWGLGKSVAALIAWPLIANYSCDPSSTPDTCSYEENMGWRYCYWTFAAVTLTMFFCRFIFYLPETPKFLLGKGRDAEAVEVIEYLARYNGTDTWLTLDHFRQIDQDLGSDAAVQEVSNNRAILERSFEAAKPDKLMSLFTSSTKGAISTSILILIWSMIGLAWPLYNNFITIYLQQKGLIFESTLSDTYKLYLYQALCAIPGCAVGGVAVELPRFGRKGTGAVVAAMTGVFLILYTLARTQSTVIAWSCMISFSQNLTAGILFAYTPETFSAPVRGTGTGLCGFFYRCWGLIAAVIASFIGVENNMPIWISAGCWIVAGLLFLVLPFESRARAST